MTVPFMKTGNTVSILAQGKWYQVKPEHPNYDAILEALHGSEEDIVALLDIGSSIENYSSGNVEVVGGAVKYDGEVVDNTLTRRIIQFMREGLPFQPLTKLFDNLMKNISYQTRTQLYDFLEHKNLPVTEDGCFLAYKAVNSNYMDKYTGTMNNSVGETVSIDRGKVDDNRDKGWGDVTVEGKMTLKNKAGRESIRQFRSTILEASSAGEGDQSIITFSKPRDVRGTALLTHSKIEPEDDLQWIFLPAVKRVKRISSSNRTGKFVSSEFSYEDLGSEEVADNDHTWIEDQACVHDGRTTCAVVESRPKNKKSGYSKRISFIDLDEYRVHQIDFYNRRGDLEKTLKFRDFRRYENRFWRAHVMIMVNLQTGKSTRLSWDDYRFSNGLTQRDFTPQRLPKSGR